MSKPSTVFSWATDATHPAGANPWSGTSNKVAPIAGLIASGYAPTEHVAAETINHMFGLIGDWIAYLDSGDFEGDVTLDGTLTIDRSVPGLAPAITADGIVAATGFRFTEIRSKRIPAASARPAGVSPSWSLNATTMLWEPSGTGALVYPVPVEFGDRIESAILWVSKQTNATVTLAASLKRIHEPTGVITTIGSSSSSANAPGVLAFNFSIAGTEPMPHQVVGDSSYYVELYSSTGGSLDRALGAEINYTRPA